MAKVGPKTIRKCSDLLFAILSTHQKGLDEAYIKAGEDALGVSLKLKLTPGKSASGVNIKVDIGYVAEQVKDSISGSVDEAQRDLFEEKEGGDQS